MASLVSNFKLLVWSLFLKHLFDIFVGYFLEKILVIYFNDIYLAFAHFLDWSLRKLFGHSLRSTCPLAKTSKIYVDVTGNNVIIYILHISYL